MKYTQVSENNQLTDPYRLAQDSPKIHYLVNGMYVVLQSGKS